MRQLIRSIILDEGGATAIEYGLIAALIAVAIIASLQMVGNNLTNKFNAIAGNLN